MFVRSLSVVLVTWAFFYESSAWKCAFEEYPTLIPNGEYKPRGKLTTAVGMTIYETGEANSTHLLIMIHDIFGIGPSTNCIEVADILSDGAFRVVLPDFFHGETWSSERGSFNADKNPEYAAFLDKHSWKNSVKVDLRKLIDHYRGNGFTKFGIFGTKFGGHMAVSASEEFSDTFTLAAQFSPAPALQSDAARVKVPMAIFIDDPEAWGNHLNLTEYCQTVTMRLGNSSCVGRGFVNPSEFGVLGGAEADWSKLENRKIAEEALFIFQQFLCKRFNE